MCRDIIITICHLNFEGESTTNFIKVVFSVELGSFFFRKIHWLVKQNIKNVQNFNCDFEQ